MKKNIIYLLLLTVIVMVNVNNVYSDELTQTPVWLNKDGDFYKNYEGQTFGFYKCLERKELPNKIVMGFLIRSGYKTKEGKLGYRLHKYDIEKKEFVVFKDISLAEANNFNLSDYTNSHHGNELCKVHDEDSLFKVILWSDSKEISNFKYDTYFLSNASTRTYMKGAELSSLQLTYRINKLSYTNHSCTTMYFDNNGYGYIQMIREGEKCKYKSNPFVDTSSGLFYNHNAPVKKTSTVVIYEDTQKEVPKEILQENTPQTEQVSKSEHKDKTIVSSIITELGAKPFTPEEFTDAFEEFQISPLDSNGTTYHFDSNFGYVEMNSEFYFKEEENNDTLIVANVKYQEKKFFKQKEGIKKPLFSPVHCNDGKCKYHSHNNSKWSLLLKVKDRGESELIGMISNRQLNKGETWKKVFVEKKAVKVIESYEDLSFSQKKETLESLLGGSRDLPIETAAISRPEIRKVANGFIQKSDRGTITSFSKNEYIQQYSSTSMSLLYKDNLFRIKNASGADSALVNSGKNMKFSFDVSSEDELYVLNIIPKRKQITFKIYDIISKFERVQCINGTCNYFLRDKTKWSFLLNKKNDKEYDLIGIINDGKLDGGDKWEVKKLSDESVEVIKAYNELKEDQRIETLRTLLGDVTDNRIDNAVNNVPQIRELMKGYIQKGDSGEFTSFSNNEYIEKKPSGDLYLIYTDKPFHISELPALSKLNISKLDNRVNPWGNTLNYFRINVANEDKQYFFITVDNKHFKNHAFKSRSFGPEMLAIITKPKGYWIIVDDYIDNTKKVFNDFKNQGFLDEVRQEFEKRGQAYRIDIIRGHNVKKEKKNYQIKNKSYFSTSADIRALKYLEDHDDKQLNEINWELHLFLARNTSSSIEDKSRDDIAERLKELGIQWLSVWEYDDRAPGEKTIYKTLFSDTFPINSEHKLIHEQAEFNKIKIPYEN